MYVCRGARHFCQKICIKNNNIPEFYMIFARKMPEFKNKIFVPIYFLKGGRHVPPDLTIHL